MDMEGVVFVNFPSITVIISIVVICWQLTMLSNNDNIKVAVCLKITNFIENRECPGLLLQA